MGWSFNVFPPVFIGLTVREVWVCIDICGVYSQCFVKVIDCPSSLEFYHGRGDGHVVGEGF